MVGRTLFGLHILKSSKINSLTLVLRIHMHNSYCHCLLTALPYQALPLEGLKFFHTKANSVSPQDFQKGTVLFAVASQFLTAARLKE